MRKVRKQVEGEKDDIIRRGRSVFAAHEQMLEQAIHDLKNTRQSLGLSLQDVADRMGTDRANVHRLENARGNPTLSTLARYAKALGKRFVITLEEQSA